MSNFLIGANKTDYHFQNVKRRTEISKVSQYR